MPHSAEAANPVSFLEKTRSIIGRVGLSLALSLGCVAAVESLTDTAVAETVSPEGKYDFENSQIVENAMQELGNTYQTGWAQPGECMVAAQRWAIHANGDKDFFNYDSGVISVWTKSGGIEVGLDKLKPGDILQKASSGDDYDTNWDHVHTVVFRGYNSDGTVKIIDSNRYYDGTVRTSDAYSIAPSNGWQWRAFRFGKIDAGNGSANILRSTDFNGDSLSDVVFFDQGAGFAVAHGQSDGRLREDGRFLPGWSRPDWGGTGDFNGDGKADLAFLNNGAGLALAYGDTNGFNEAGRHLTNWGQPQWGGTGDFNGDGRSDIAFFNQGSGLALAYGAPNGFNEAGRHLTNWGAPTWAGVGDFNADGRSDIAFLIKDRGVVVALGSANGFIENGWNLAGWGAPEWAGVGDFNGDTYDDIAFFNQGSGLAVGRGQSDGHFVEGGRFLAGWARPAWGGTGDYDGDGKSDIAFYQPGSGLIVALGRSSGFAETPWQLSNWNTPVWASNGEFPGQPGNGFPHPNS